jgi:hypothetical protein
MCIGYLSEERRDPRKMQRRNHTDVDSAAEKAGNIAHRIAGIVQLAQHDFGTLAERRTRLGQEDTLAYSPKQWRTQRTLELGDLLRDTRLRDLQALGGAREILGFRDRQEISQMTDFDRLTHSRTPAIKAR